MKYALIFIHLITALSFSACNGPSKTALQSGGITGVRWKLVELNSQPVNVQPNEGKEPFIQFEANSDKVLGNAGCNSFGGTYTLDQNNSIRLSQLYSTKMACKSLDIETRFLKVLELADHYEISSNTLILAKKGLGTTARFTRMDKP